MLLLYIICSYLTHFRSSLLLVIDHLIKSQSCHHIETSQLICYANQLTGLYMIATLTFNALINN